MPLAGVLVVEQTHSGDVLDRECALFSIGVVIYKLEHTHVGLLLLDHLLDVVIAKHVLKKRMAS